MLLEPTDTVVCFMSKSHHLLKSSTWKMQLKLVMEKKKLKSTYYFGFEMKVVSNIYRGDILDGLFLKKVLAYNCTMRGGHGLAIKFSNYHQQMITFDNFMTNGDYSFIVYSRTLENDPTCAGKLLSV